MLFRGKYYRSDWVVSEMADITYCDNTDCPNKKCDRHPTKISRAAIDGRGYVSVANFGGTCRWYLGYLLEKIQNDRKKEK